MLDIITAPVVLPVKFVIGTGKALVNVGRDVHRELHSNVENFSKGMEGDYTKYKRATKEQNRKEFIIMLVVIALGFFFLYGCGFFS